MKVLGKTIKTERMTIMPKYEVSFKRIEYGFVTVEAANRDEACGKSYDAYHAGNAEWGDEEISSMKANEVDK